MRKPTAAQGIYRIVVVVDDSVEPYAAGCATRYEAAQARVAAAVQHFADRGAGVREVVLQRRVSHVHQQPAAGASGEEWLAERSWGGDVVERILRQRGHRPLAGERTARRSRFSPASTGAPGRTSDTVSAETLPVHSPASSPAAETTEAGRAAPAVPHRRTRWELGLTAVLCVTALAGLMLLHRGSGPAHAAVEPRERTPITLDGLRYEPPGEPESPLATVDEPFARRGAIQSAATP